MTGVDRPDEAELWQRILSGDRSAFEVWHAQYHSRLMAFLRNRCRPPLDPDDLAQTVWLRVWERRSQWDSTAGSFSSWLIRVAENVRIDLLRTLQRRPVQQLVTDADPAAPSQTEVRPELRALQDCLQELGGPFMEVLRLRIEDELSDAAVAERLGIAIGTVSSRVSRGKSEVRQCVERKLS